MSREEDVAKWQKQLADTFSTNGVIGGSILPAVMELERRTGADFVNRYKGHRILTDSFSDFFAVTLSASVGQVHKHDWPNAMLHYPWCMLSFLVLFRGTRAAEILSVNGYPLDGYALQRNLMEQAMYLGAITSGVSSFPALSGTAQAPKDRKWTDADKDAVRKSRTKEERRVFDLMIGGGSGLAADHLYELERWDHLFDMQVHGSRFTTFGEAGRWMFKKGEPFSIGPLPDEDASAMYINRSTEIAWMSLRVLPFLQLPDRDFGAEWARQWGILDESFRFAVEGLGSLGKKIAGAFIAFVDAKFNFTPATRYIER